MDPSLHASSSSAPNTMSSDQPSNSKVIQLNESVYELHRPTGTPSMQVLLFHGLQFQDCSDAHSSTWLSRDGSQVWPKTWLVDQFPGAHVLSISYDARVVKGDGKLDLYLIAENLTSDLLTCTANIGQEPGCPVILVGHCFGGLVIKQLCWHMHTRKSVDSKGVSSSREGKFLEKVRGIFYYATPHHGISEDIAKHFAEGPLLRFVTILSADTARLNYDFDYLQKYYKNAWKIAGVVESLPTERGPFRSRVVVEEASAREGASFNVVEDADHISICRPTRKLSRSFYALTNHLDAIVKDSKVELIQEVNLPVHQCQGLPHFPVELAERAQEIEEILKTAPVLGIVGMGGVGKTTVAKAVFNNISKEFEYTCFVDYVKGIEKHQREAWILSQFHCSGLRVDGTKTEWFDLRGKKMLLVLDDIDSEEQLMFLPPLESFGDHSRVIITSRVQSVLKVFGTYVCHEVEFLNDRDAQKLFCKHAFGQEDIPVSFARRELVADVVRKCGGLPLTLEVMGRYLCGHENSANFWEETIGRLGKAQTITGDQDDKVWATLRVSTDALVKGEKEMFTSAATYFFGLPLERALAAWSTSCRNSETGWENLVTRCLVKEVCEIRYNDDNKKEVCKVIWVHEHLRDLADKILSPNNRLDASDEESATELVERLNFKQVDVETEYLDLSYPYENLSETRRRNKQRTVLCRFLLNMKQLKYMKLKAVLLKGSPKKFPGNLSLLTWIGVREEGLQFPVSCIEEMQSLAILELENWQTSHTFPVALGKLTNLCILRLRSMKPVVVRKFTDHCTLCVKPRKAVDLLPEDLGQLSRLQRMELVDLGVMKLPGSFGSLSSLKILSLKNIELLKLPESFSNLSSLEQLSFDRIGHLELPESFGKLSSLVLLFVDKCENLAILPQSFGLLCSLEELTLGSWWSATGVLESLPDTFGQLRALKKLTMSQYKLLCLPSSFCDLESLQELKMHAKGLETLPANLGALKSLQELDLIVRNVKALPESVGHLSSLRQLRFVSNFAEKLPESLWHLASLQQLTLEVDMVKVLSEKVGQLSSLRQLSFTSNSVEKLPESLWQLASLQELDLDVHRVKSLSEKVGQLSLLRELEFRSSAAETLPRSLGQLDSLQWLTLLCPNVKTLPTSLGRLSSLGFFEVDASSLASLPESLGNLSSLKTLMMWEWKFEYLPEWLGHLSSLEALFLNGCEKLKSIPDSLGRWTLEQENTNTQNSNSPLKGMTLYVDRCPLFDHFVLSSLGWVKDIVNSFGDTDCYLKAY